MTPAITIRQDTENAALVQYAPVHLLWIWMRQITTATSIEKIDGSAQQLFRQLQCVTKILPRGQGQIRLGQVQSDRNEDQYGNVALSVGIAGWQTPSSVVPGQWSASRSSSASQFEGQR